MAYTIQFENYFMAENRGYGYGFKKSALLKNWGVI
jgi:hypothetical protein